MCGYKIYVDAAIEVCSGGHGSKEEACQPCKMEEKNKWEKTHQPTRKPAISCSKY